MIQFKPVSEKESVKSLFPAVRSNTENIFPFIATEQEKTIGKLCLLLTENSCEILEIEAQDFLIAEGILRSALYFAANRGAYMALCGLKEYGALLTSLQFTETDGLFRGEIPTILTCSSCKCKASGKLETP